MSAVALPGPSLPFFLDGYGAERIPSPPLLRYQATQDSLTSLNIERNNIDDAGAQELADALKVNSSLTSLNLGRNEIGDAGARELAGALKVNSSLKDLKWLAKQWPVPC